MDYKVKKGLEQPLRIQGMLTKYFYTWLVIGAVCVVILLFLLMQASRPKSSVTVLDFIVAFFICGGLVLILKLWFVRKSQIEKMKFKNIKTVISNIDVMKTIK